MWVVDGVLVYSLGSISGQVDRRFAQLATDVCVQTHWEWYREVRCGDYNVLLCYSIYNVHDHSACSVRCITIACMYSPCSAQAGI